MTEQQRTGRSYDRAANQYAGTISDELRRKPFDRALLDTVADAAGGGIVADGVHLVRAGAATRRYGARRLPHQ